MGNEQPVRRNGNGRWQSAMGNGSWHGHWKSTMAQDNGHRHLPQGEAIGDFIVTPRRVRCRCGAGPEVGTDIIIDVRPDVCKSAEPLASSVWETSSNRRSNTELEESILMNVTGDPNQSPGFQAMGRPGHGWPAPWSDRSQPAIASPAIGIANQAMAS